MEQLEGVGEMMKFKCHNCLTIVPDKPCPICKESERIEPMCENDHTCTCTVDITDGIRYCEKCGKPICPCGSHDVANVSRVTGYLSDVAGWNEGKQQELRDRTRYDASKGLI